MIDDSAVSAGHPDMDYAEHDRTYHLFLLLLRNGAIGVVCVIVVLAFIWG